MLEECPAFTTYFLGRLKTKREGLIEESLVVMSKSKHAGMVAGIKMLDEILALARNDKDACAKQLKAKPGSDPV